MHPFVFALSAIVSVCFFQRLLSDMDSFKQQVQAVQLCQSALLVPEEVMHNLAICRTALRLQQEASQLQHVAIQQCNILQVQIHQYDAISYF